MEGNKLYPTIEFEPHEETRVSQRTLRSDLDSETPPSQMVIRLIQSFLRAFFGF